MTAVIVNSSHPESNPQMPPDTRQRMIEGAVRLLALHGLQETSFSTVLELTGAPRGSIYHHFPRGKDEMIASAVDLAGQNANAAIDGFDRSTAVSLATAFLGLWRQLLVRSEFRAGCSVLAVTVATDSPDLLEHTSAVFRGWRRHLADLLAEAGLPADTGARFSAALVAGAEGGVVLSRAEHDLEPFELVAADLLDRAAQLDAMVGRAPAA